MCHFISASPQACRSQVKFGEEENLKIGKIFKFGFKRNQCIVLCLEINLSNVKLWTLPETAYSGGKILSSA